MANQVAGSLSGGQMRRMGGARKRKSVGPTNRVLSEIADNFRQDRKRFLASRARFMKFKKKDGKIGYYKKVSGTFKNGVEWRAVSGKLTATERRQARTLAVSFENMRSSPKGSRKGSRANKKKAAPRKAAPKKAAPKKKAAVKAPATSAAPLRRSSRLRKGQFGARKSYVVKNGKRTKTKRPSAAAACRAGKPLGTIVTYDGKKKRLARMKTKDGKMTCTWRPVKKSPRKSPKSPARRSPKRTRSGAKYGGRGQLFSFLKKKPPPPHTRVEQAKAKFKELKNRFIG
jgi:hypothetical protein